jgi:hypothetical protein
MGMRKIEKEKYDEVVKKDEKLKKTMVLLGRSLPQQYTAKRAPASTLRLLAQSKADRSSRP